MTPKDTLDYDKKKTVIVRQFRYRVDGYRENFKLSQPFDGKTGQKNEQIFRDVLQELQIKDSTLAVCCKQIGSWHNSKERNSFGFLRKERPPNVQFRIIDRQKTHHITVPKRLRSKVLEVTHDTTLARDVAVKRKTDWVLSTLFGNCLNG